MGTGKRVGWPKRSPLLVLLLLFSPPFSILLSTPSDSFSLPLFILSLSFTFSLFPSLPPDFGTRAFCDLTFMASQDKGRPLPKFGEWDVNNPASAEGFTVIFNKARDEKKTNAHAGVTVQPQKPNGGYKPDHDYDFPTKRKWFCCG
ncbi:hypothetical protein H6P81_012458 [Aristolochia fimbriata]|uniref:RIN4 pathogenic type III effector avirulence factor Avr cleavage site domain-containing protein n=1 Tax=Aristolochia fimbriata TaxID=158543 RepID=A0AAV7EBV7_ARIFI|nr:hypothetical protein H6P81_012458 [Aristolochia fimbriata]